MTHPEAPAPGLQRAGARVPLPEYTQRLWDRRHFVFAYSTASNAVGYEGSFLGQAWQLLTPLLNIFVYYLIFGLLLKTTRGVPNFIAFLSVGVFFFALMTEAIIQGAKSISSNLGLVRALQFPRAVLPMSTTLVALLKLLYSLVVLIPIVLISGEPLTWHWLELVPVLVLQSMFCLAVAFITARLGAQVPDTSQVLPFFTRMWMYASGVMFSVTKYTSGHGLVSLIIQLNPGYIYLSLARNALLVSNPVSATTWLAGFGWSFGLLAVSYLYFWRGEETYGNV